ncbi:MAG: hypothetical protein U1F67_14695 [Rubrivivax sp.]
MVTIDGRRDDILLPAGEGMRFARGEAVAALCAGRRGELRGQGLLRRHAGAAAGLGRQGGRRGCAACRPSSATLDRRAVVPMIRMG